MDCALDARPAIAFITYFIAVQLVAIAIADNISIAGYGTLHSFRAGHHCGDCGSGRLAAAAPVRGGVASW